MQKSDFKDSYFVLFIKNILTLGQYLFDIFENISILTFCGVEIAPVFREFEEE